MISKVMRFSINCHIDNFIIGCIIFQETCFNLFSLYSLLPKQINGFERLSNPDVFNGNIDFCKVCAQNIKFIHGKHR